MDSRPYAIARPLTPICAHESVHSLCRHNQPYLNPILTIYIYKNHQSIVFFLIDILPVTAEGMIFLDFFICLIVFLFRF